MNLKGKRTAIVSLLIMVFGALETFDWTSIFNDNTSGIVMMVISVIMFLLRTVTDTAIGKSIGGGGIDTGE